MKRIKTVRVDEWIHQLFALSILSDRWAQRLLTLLLVCGRLLQLTFGNCDDVTAWSVIEFDGKCFPHHVSGQFFIPDSGQMRKQTFMCLIILCSLYYWIEENEKKYFIVLLWSHLGAQSAEHNCFCEWKNCILFEAWTRKKSPHKVRGEKCKCSSGGIFFTSHHRSTLWALGSDLWRSLRVKNCIGLCANKVIRLRVALALLACRFGNEWLWPAKLKTFHDISSRWKPRAQKSFRTWQTWPKLASSELIKTVWRRVWLDNSGAIRDDT